MNVKSKSYMQNTEFKERQSAFSFFCARALEYLMEFKAECAKGWKAMFKKTARFENKTLELVFEKLTHREWQEKAQQVYLKLVNS